MKGIVSVALIQGSSNEEDGDFNGVSIMEVLGSADQIGRWHGPLSELPLGRSIRNRVYAGLANGQAINVMKVSRDIVHKAPDFNFKGEVTVFEPDSLERIEKLFQEQNEDVLANYRGPKAFFNVMKGECYWTSSDSDEFGLPIYQIDKGRLMVLAGYMKLVPRKGKTTIGEFTPTPFATSYIYEGTNSRTGGTLDPYNFPQAIDEDKALWVTGGYDVTLSRLDDENITTPSGPYRVEFHKAAGITSYVDMSGIAIYYPLDKMDEIDSLNDGPFEISQDSEKWEKVANKKFSKIGNDPAVFITADGDSTSVDAYESETGEKVIGPVEGKVKTRFSQKKGVLNMIAPILLGSAAAVGGAKLLSGDNTNKSSVSTEPKRTSSLDVSTSSKKGTGYVRSTNRFL